MNKTRLALIPLAALVIALLSYPLGPFNAAGDPVEAQAVVVNPAAQPPVQGEAADVSAAGSADIDRRIAFWLDRIRDNPNSDLQYQYLGELFNLKARVTGDVNQYVQARQAFETAVDLNDRNSSARSGLANTYLALHEWTAAIEAGTAILQADPRAHGAVAVIGDASLEIGDLDTAIAAFETLRETAGGSAIEARFGRVAFLQGSTKAAIRILEDSAAAAAAINRPATELAAYDYAIGEYRFSQGDVEGADRAYRASLSRLPGYYLSIAGLGRVAYARGDLEGAIDAYRRATAIIPRPELLAYLGDLLALSGETAAAEEQYRAVDFIAELSDVQAAVSNREIVLFQASHDRDTAHAVRLARAELEVRKDIYGYDALAWALYGDGQAAKALEPALRSLALGTQDPKLLYHAGMIEIAVGQTSAGRAHLEAALALNPAFDPLGAEAARAALAD